MSFPRLSASGISPLLGKRPRTPDSSLFASKRLNRIEVATSSSSKKGSKRPSLNAALQPVSVAGKDVKQVDPLSFNKFSVGTLVMGYVLQFSTQFAVISLPGGLTGVVPLEEVSDTLHQLCATVNSQRKSHSSASSNGLPALSDVLSLMQPVRCYVKEVLVSPSQAKTGADTGGKKTKKSLVLSLRSSLVNRGLALKHLSQGLPLSGCISSIEDHGYVVSAGVSGCTFFLPFTASGSDKTDKDKGQEKDKSSPSLVVGQPVECLVQEVNMTARSATLRMHRTAVVKATVNSTILPFNALTPGMKMQVKVEAVIPNGLKVQFLDQFFGVVDSSSLLQPMSDKETRAYFSQGSGESVRSTHEARIVFVDHGSRVVRFSMRPHVIEFHPPAHLPPLGDIVRDALVKVTQKRRGVLLSLASDEDVIELKKIDAAAAASADSTSKKKGAKAMAAEDQRRREVAERVVGVFVHKSALVAVEEENEEEDEEEEEEEEEEEDEDDDDDEDDAKTSSKKAMKIKARALAKKKASQTNKKAKAAAMIKTGSVVEESLLEKQYHVGKVVSVVRVVGYHLVEGLAVGSTLNLPTSSSSLTVQNSGDRGVEGGVFHWTQVQSGQVMHATVHKVHDFGLVVKLSPKIKAVCPSLHASDVGMTAVQLKKKFKMGQVIKVRVWEAKERAMIVTHKRSLVEDTDAPILSYEDVTSGRSALGVVSKISEDGLKIHFYNDVKGLVTMAVLVKQGVVDVAEAYRVGQVVRCMVILKRTTTKKNKTTGKEGMRHRVFLALALSAYTVPALLALLEGDAQAQGLGLASGQGLDTSMDTSTSKTVDTDTNNQTMVKSSSGSSSSSNGGSNGSAALFVSGVVNKVDASAGLISVRLDDGRLAALHKHQLADFATTAEVLFASSSTSNDNGTGTKIVSANGSDFGGYSVGTRVEGALVMAVSKRVVALSLKPLLLAAAAGTGDANATTAGGMTMSCPSKVTELVPGQLVVGYIVKVDTYGVLVRFRDTLTALVPRPNIADKFVATPAGLFHEGDAVRCVVQRVDLERERVIATFKATAVPPSQGLTCYLSALLRENYFMAKYNTTSNSTSLTSSAPSSSSSSSSSTDSTTRMLDAWRSFHVSQVVRATVTSVESYGVVLLASDQMTMMFARGIHHIKSSLKPSTTTSKAGKSSAAATVVEVVVLDFDYQNKVVEVSMRDGLVESATKAASAASATSAVAVSKKNKSVKTAAATGGGGVLTVMGGNVHARVELVKPRYLVVSLTDNNNHSGPCAGAVIAYLMLADYHCPHLLSTSTPSTGADGGGADTTHPTSAIYQEGQMVSAVVVQPALTTQPSVEAKSGLHGSVAILSIAYTLKGDHKAVAGATITARGGTGGEDSADDRQASNQEAAKVFLASLRLGAVLPWKVVSVGPTEMMVKPHSRAAAAKVQIRAMVHVTGSIDHIKQGHDAIALADGMLTPQPHPFHGINVGDKVLARVVQLRAGTQGQGKEGGRKKANTSVSAAGQGQGEGDDDASITTTAISVYLSLEGLSQPVKGDNGDNSNPDSSSSSSKNKRKRGESVDSVASLGQDDIAGDGGGGGPWSPMVQLWGKHAVAVNTIHAAVVTAISSDGPASSSSASSSSSSGSPVIKDVTGCTVALSPYINARLHYLDISRDIEVVRAFRDTCFVGQRILVAVTDVLDDPVTGKPKTVCVSRLPVEQCLLGLATASSSSSVTDKKKKKQKLLTGAAAAAAAASSSLLSSLDMAGLAKAYATMITTSIATTATTSKKKSASTAAPGLGQASHLPVAGAIVPGILLFSDSIVHHQSHTHHLNNHHGHIRIPQPPALILSLGQGVCGRVCLTELADPKDWQDCSALMALVNNSAAANATATGTTKKAADKSSSSLSSMSVYGLHHGDIVQCRVLSSGPKALTNDKGSDKNNNKDKEKYHKEKMQFMNVSLRPSRLNSDGGNDDGGDGNGESASSSSSTSLLEVGSLVSAFVANISLAKGCFLRLPGGATGQVLIKDLDDDFVTDPVAAYPPGTLVRARVLTQASDSNNDDSNHTNDNDNSKSSSARTSMPILSLKTSVVEGDVKAAREILKIHEGAVVEGVVQRVASVGVFVQIKGTSLVGLSRKPAALDDVLAQDLEDVYHPGDLVRAKVLKVSVKSKKIALGLRDSFFRSGKGREGRGGKHEEEEEEEEEDEEDDDDDDDEEEDDDDDDNDEDEDDEDEEEEEGDGYVKMVDDSDEEEDEMDAMIRAASLAPFDEDDYVDDEDDDDDDDDDDDASSRPSKKSKTSKKVGAARASNYFNDDNGDDDNDDDDDDADKEEEEDKQEEEEEEEDAPLFPKSRRIGASGGGGLMQWGDFLSGDKSTATKTAGDDDDDDDEEEDDAEDDDDEDDDANADQPSSKRLRTKAKEALLRRQEREIRERETALVSGTALANPEQPRDFERLLLATPGDSELWTRYMAFHVLQADLAAARSIAERALRTIDFRQEEEKMNLWIAYVNLEHKYGTMDSLNKVFQRAVTESRGKYIHLNLAEQYEKAKDFAGAAAIFEKALKKHKKSKKVWTSYQISRLRAGDHVGARALLGRSLQSLSRHKHIEVLTKYALAEFDVGSQDRGRSVFEELVSSYPKRTDLWHVYVDKEIKSGMHDRTRQLFERMIASTAMNPRNVKVVFKKYMAFEQVNGTHNQQEEVKRKAREYVQRLA